MNSDMQEDITLRASASLDELRFTLDGKTRLPRPHSLPSPSSRNVPSDVESDLTYRTAAENLHKWLFKHDSHSHPGHLPSGKVPSRPLSATPFDTNPQNEHLSNLLQNQSTYIQMLEAENKFVQTNTRRSVSMENVENRNQLQKFEQNNQRMIEMYKMQNERLESQLKQTRDESLRKDHDLERLQTRLRQSESSSQQNTASSLHQAGVIIDPNVSSFERVQQLSKERDELLEAVTQLKLRVETMRRRESELCEQLSISIETVEEAKLEETRAMVQSRQLTDELEHLRERFEEAVMDSQRKAEEERRLARLEVEREVEDLRRQVLDLENQVAQRDTRLEKMARNKTALAEQCESARMQLRTYEQDFSKNRDDMTAAATRAGVQRDQAVAELQRMRERLDSEQRERQAERQILKAELEDLRERLSAAEQGVMQSNEERLRLTNQQQALERELNFAKMSRESVERGRAEEVNSVKLMGAQRESELQTYISQLESRHEVVVAELNEMLSKHNGLAQRLREELRKATQQMEQMRERYGGELERTRWERDQALGRADRSTRRLAELESQVVEHGRTHEKMKERLRQMDTAAQQQAQQVLDLLSKQNSLLRDRHMLAKEVEFLRVQLSESAPYNLPDSDKRILHGKGVVSTILEEVRRQPPPNYRSAPQSPASEHDKPVE